VIQGLGLSVASGMRMPWNACPKMREGYWTVLLPSLSRTHIAGAKMNIDNHNDGLNVSVLSLFYMTLLS
jgi:hypothetical protein